MKSLLTFYLKIKAYLRRNKKIYVGEKKVETHLNKTVKFEIIYISILKLKTKMMYSETLGTHCDIYSKCFYLITANYLTQGLRVLSNLFPVFLGFPIIQTQKQNRFFYQI